MRISDWSSDVCSSDLKRTHDRVIAVGAKFGPDTEQSGNERGAQHRSPMMVGAIGNSCHAACIGAGLAIEPNRPAAGQYQPVPGKPHALLPRSDFAVIFADKPRPLGSEPDAPGRAVIDRKRVV